MESRVETLLPSLRRSWRQWITLSVAVTDLIPAIAAPRHTSCRGVSTAADATPPIMTLLTPCGDQNRAVLLTPPTLVRNKCLENLIPPYSDGSMPLWLPDSENVQSLKLEHICSGVSWSETWLAADDQQAEEGNTHRMVDLYLQHDEGWFLVVEYELMSPIIPNSTDQGSVNIGRLHMDQYIR